VVGDRTIVMKKNNDLFKYRNRLKFRLMCEGGYIN